MTKIFVISAYVLAIGTALALAAKLTILPWLSWWWVALPTILALLPILGGFVIIGIFFYYGKSEIKTLFKKQK